MLKKILFEIRINAISALFALCFVMTGLGISSTLLQLKPVLPRTLLEATAVACFGASLFFSGIYFADGSKKQGVAILALCIMMLGLISMGYIFFTLGQL